MISVKVFYITFGLFLGIFLIFASAPKPKIILKKPTISNIKNTTYIDENSTCYKYYAKKISC